MTEPPSGQVTFLFTDVQGSTVLWEQQPERMNDALAEHDGLMLATIEANDGYVFSTAGDSFAVAFATAAAAVATATAVQLALEATTVEPKLQIRMGLHTGEASLRDGDYFGVEVNRCARIMAAAHGGQIVLSQATADGLPTDAQLVDLGDHLFKDLSRPERIYQLDHPDLRSHFPKLKALGGPPSDLPASLTRFIGREEELIELNRLLSQNRLVTLTGSGGAGKTRLAFQMASDAHYQFPDGVRIVELAAVSEADVLIEEVAQVFGVQGAADTPMIDTLVAAIGAQRALLILDNCEHLVDAASDLVSRILSGCPNIKVLSTTRELLHVPGEVVYRVPSLSLPSADADLDSILECDAVSLFVDRGLLSNPDFELTVASVDDVVSICTRLDGIPLALELAAARLRVMSPAQIAERLDERFLSVAGENTAGSRHRTLHNAIDWSYNLLDPSEKLLFQRLSIFTGDFSLEAAECVCAGEPIDDIDVADLLFGLVDKSMVKPERGAGGSTRYQLLESIRNYGLRRLEEANQLDVLLAVHSGYYTGYCESLQAQQRSGALGTALADLDENEDNIRAALRSALDGQRLDLAARMVGALGYLWYAAGLYREAIDWCAELFDEEPELPDDIWAAVLHAYGTLLGSWAQPHRGAAMLEQEIELRRGLADPARLAAALNNLGNLQHDIGRFDEAEVTLREAIDQFRIAGEAPTLALASLGSGYLHAGDIDRASALYSEALEEAVAAEDAYGVALSTSYLGHCAALQGQLEEGRGLVDEARSRFEALNVTPGIANADFHLALIDRAEGNVVDAAGRLLASLSAPEAHWYLATQYWIMQTVASIIGDGDRAAALLGAASAHYEDSDELQPAYVLDDLVETTATWRARGEPDEFERALARGRRVAPTEAVAAAVRALETIISDPVDTYA